MIRAGDKLYEVSISRVQLSLPGDKRSELCLQVVCVVLIHRKHNRPYEIIVQVVLMAKPCQLAIWQVPGVATGVAIALGSLEAGECWRVVSAYGTGRGSASGF